jgi:hypothetical protein
MSTKTFAALFATRHRASEAVDSLKDAGIAGRKISVLSHEELKDGETGGLSAGEGAAAGAAGAAIGGVIASLGLAAVPGIGWIMAAGPIGSMIATGATAAAAGAVGGGIAGALTDNGIDKEDADIYAEALRRGGTLVIVEADLSDASKVGTMLRSHHPVNIERLREDYKADGWVRYDPKAEPYTGADLRKARSRFDDRTLRGTQPPPHGTDPYLRAYGHASAK